jgi:hypothetical protein
MAGAYANNSHCERCGRQFECVRSPGYGTLPVMAEMRPPGDWGDSRVPLYHVTASPIPAGRVLRPYAIGREHATVIQQAVNALREGAEALALLLAGDAWEHLRREGDRVAEMILLEALFERVRVAVAPRSLSRLNAVFAWRRLGLARRYRAEYRPGGVVLRCVLDTGTAEERDGAVVVGAFETADLADPRPRDLRRVEALARRYWAGRAPMAFPELLVRGRVRVEGVITEGGLDPFTGAP